ncbi:hypothetical protein C8R43DRAFT_1009921 [Mycena crocata]|nr:hypothetical protein C8R43DRAFT_1009921 [Mycena crocata]
MEQTRSRKSKKAPKESVDRDVVCSVCGGAQKDQSERFRICSGCSEKLGTRRYFCSRACQKTDWKIHKEFCGSQDFWDYPHKPLLAADADFERPAALRCQIALIDSDPDVLYHVAPGTDDVVRFRITDKMLNVSFRRVRDKAFMKRDPEAIAILGQTLVRAVEEEAVGPSPTSGNAVVAEADSTSTRIANVYSQLADEYSMPGIKYVVAGLLDDQEFDPARPTQLERLHQENMAKHGSDFWRALARPLD